MGLVTQVDTFLVLKSEYFDICILYCRAWSTALQSNVGVRLAVVEPSAGDESVGATMAGVVNAHTEDQGPDSVAVLAFTLQYSLLSQGRGDVGV